MEKRNAIIDSAIVLFGSIGFDGATTPEIANKVSVTKPLPHCLDILPVTTSTEFQKIANPINLLFRVVDEMPEEIRLTAYHRKWEFEHLWHDS